MVLLNIVIILDRNYIDCHFEIEIEEKSLYLLIFDKNTYEINEKLFLCNVPFKGRKCLNELSYCQIFVFFRFFNNFNILITGSIFHKSLSLLSDYETFKIPENSNIF